MRTIALFTANPVYGITGSNAINRYPFFDGFYGENVKNSGKGLTGRDKLPIIHIKSIGNI